ncbi:MULTISPECIES: HlyD family secretion protein [unclassified Cyanobium]|uniref:HlyD family secretion protein n=1 Tax=unclassified Cyanobium TaxID=2627006 RepID=UPI0020CF62B0|nr:MULTISPECIES: HlyD family efflux transporter periplasmic adaptor subunit [unclassified Cyanobium]MCP9796891.1 HlyD family efflux transporter periplasmic adaptor subunit [Cyanobium sp. Lug-B]MCP9933651.1 HlyD family efflux transporter periplasmic adaptor subunit [Cyanobium sp. Candia 9D4]
MPPSAAGASEPDSAGPAGQVLDVTAPDIAATDDDDAIPSSRRADLTILLISAGLLITALAIVINFFTARSRDAVINATPIVLRSPVTGTLESLNVGTGVEVRPGQTLAIIVNPRASRDTLSALETELETARGRLQELRTRRDLRQKLVERLSQDARQQRNLEVARDQGDRDSLGFALDRARKELAFAQRETQRQEELFRAGAVAANVVDRARTTELQRAREVRGLEAQLAGQAAVLEASRNELTLRNNRSNSDPVVRLQEATIALENAEGDVRTQAFQVSGLEQQVAVARKEWQERSSARLISPRKAVIWQLGAQRGDSVDAMQSVIQMIDCSQRWLTTTVAENDLNRIRLGSKAKIELVGSRDKLRGEVVGIRSGIGRTQLGEEAPTPVPINLARESEVKIRILNDFPAPPGEFCYVGFTAKVSFQR